jgi:hypothetical protein
VPILPGACASQEARHVPAEHSGEEVEGRPLLYLIRETKSSPAPGDLRGQEAQKIHCGSRHFNGALGVDYKVVQTADELP